MCVGDGAASPTGRGDRPYLGFRFAAACASCPGGSPPPRPVLLSLGVQAAGGWARPHPARVGLGLVCPRRQVLGHVGGAGAILGCCCLGRGCSGRAARPTPGVRSQGPVHCRVPPSPRCRSAASLDLWWAAATAAPPGAARFAARPSTSSRSLAAAALAVAPIPNAEVAPADRPLVTVHAGEARLRLVSDAPDVTFHLRTATASLQGSFGVSDGDLGERVRDHLHCSVRG